VNEIAQVSTWASIKPLTDWPQDSNLGSSNQQSRTLITSDQTSTNALMSNKI